MGSVARLRLIGRLLNMFDFTGVQYKVIMGSIIISCTHGVLASVFVRIEIASNNNHVAAVALTPLTTHPHVLVELVRSPVRGQEQEQPGVVPS